MTINNEILQTKRAVSDILFAYRQIYGSSGQPLSFRQLADTLNQYIDLDSRQVTHQTLKNWEDRLHLPRPGLIMHLAFNASGWQRTFAEDLLAAMRPDLYKPASNIGVRALARSLQDTGPLKPRFDPYYLSPHDH